MATFRVITETEGGVPTFFRGRQEYLDQAKAYEAFVVAVGISPAGTIVTLMVDGDAHGRCQVRSCLDGDAAATMVAARRL